MYLNEKRKMTNKTTIRLNIPTIQFANNINDQKYFYTKLCCYITFKRKYNFRKNVYLIQ